MYTDVTNRTERCQASNQTGFDHLTAYIQRVIDQMHTRILFV